MPRAGNCASAMFPDESSHGPELCLLIHHRFEWKWAMGGGIVRLRASCEAGIGRRKRLPHRGKGAQGRAFLENRPALREDRSLTVAAPIGAARVSKRYPDGQWHFHHSLRRRWRHEQLMPPHTQVTAPSLALETNLQYLANTPVL